MRIKATLAALSAASLLGLANTAGAIAIDAYYAGSYTYTDLGSVPGLPTNYGGLTFDPSNPDRILIGGAANSGSGRIYGVDVVRGAGNHIVGFTGSATALGSYGEFNDGGVVFGPGGVLFLAQWSVNNIGQVAPGATDESRVDAGASIGIPGDVSISALNFVPAGFGGAGRMKIVTYVGGSWYDVAYTPDGSGTYDLAATRVDLDPGTPGTIDNLPGGPEGFTYILGGNPLFSVDSMLVAEYAGNRVASYEVDAQGNPILSTRRDFVTGLSGAEGAVIDPLTGDFVFSTFGGGNQVIVVQGFTVIPGGPTNHVPLPGTLLLLGAGLGALGLVRRRG